MGAGWYDATTPLIPVQHQPAMLVEHLHSLDIDPDALFAGAGLPALALSAPTLQLSLAQLLQLLRVAAQGLRNPELSFQLGRHWLPGHYGTASHALLTAGSLRRALQVLCRHSTRLSPLLVPHVAVDGRLATLYWTDACACAGMRTFLVEMQMSAFADACRWLAGEHLPWSFLFNRGEPGARDAHEVHLGTNLRFECHLDAMVIDASWLDIPWRNPHAVQATTVLDALDQEARAQEPRRNLLQLVYDYLLANVCRAPSLDDAAAAFATSPATFKRRLSALGTHFQAELDQVRLHTALRLMNGGDLDTEAIGRHLGFADPANFRRSMKRWAGLTPAQLRGALHGLVAAP